MEGVRVHVRVVAEGEKFGGGENFELRREGNRGGVLREERR